MSLRDNSNCTDSDKFDENEVDDEGEMEIVECAKSHGTLFIETIIEYRSSKQQKSKKSLEPFSVTFVYRLTNQPEFQLELN